MNHQVNRDPDDMLRFSERAGSIADELESVTNSLRRRLSDAHSYMQDASGLEALDILQELTEQSTAVTRKLRILAGQIASSARLLKESESLL